MRKKYNYGFTIVELMITLALFGIVMGVVFTSFRLNEVSRDDLSNQIEVFRKNKKFHDTLASELKLCSPSQYTFVDTSTIRFKIPIENPTDYDITWGMDGQVGWWIQYERSGMTIVRRVLNAALIEQSRRVITDNVTNLIFGTAPGNVITVESKVEKTAFSRGRSNLAENMVQLVHTSQIKLRNE